MNTKRYEGKRDFRKTPEPKGGDKRSSGSGKRPIFVIQEHAASTHHYDFRLEADGVLKSWAIPKGPSTDPREKRLAVRTEDHPLDYADFEGVIPKEEYGGGTVIVWDTGPYDNLTEDEDGEELPMAEAVQRGHAVFRVHGKKLKGGYALQRTGLGKADEDNWLLVKMRDDEADARRNPVSTEPESVKSGHTIEDVKEAESGDGSKERGDD